MSTISRGIVLCAVLFVSGPARSQAQVEKVADGFQFVEGPVWKEGVGLLFSDINGNTIYRWSPDSGVAPYVRPSGNANGLALDAQGRLLAAQQGSRQVVRFEPNGTQTILAVRFEGKRLNSPNDLVVKSDGSIWFTDPPYGISSGQEELGFYGIYRIGPSGALQLLDKSLRRPNGIVFSPGEKKLYVNDSEARIIYVWDIVSDTAIANRRQFAFMNVVGYADGMKVDAGGHLFSAGPLGIWVFAPDGTPLDTILVPGQTTNCNWGDSDRRTLYITSGTTVYKTRPLLTSIDKSGRRGYAEGAYELSGNYPNPFNASTTITYRVSSKSPVRLSVFDLLGREVAPLVNADMEAGNHDVSFDGSGLASGVYFTRLQVGDLSRSSEYGLAPTKRLLLLR
jgi:gluconolactonase